MADKTQSLQGEENQAEDLIKQDYHVRVSDGQKFIVPNALEDVDAPLARMHKPDYSMAVNMPGGVSLLSLDLSYNLFPLLFCVADPEPDPDILFSLG